MSVQKTIDPEVPGKGGTGPTYPRVLSEDVNVVWDGGTMVPRSVNSGIYTYRAGQVVVPGEGLDDERMAALGVREVRTLNRLDDGRIARCYEAMNRADLNKGAYVPRILDQLSDQGDSAEIHHVCGITPYYMISEGDPEPEEEAAFDAYRSTVRDTVQQVFQDGAAGPPTDEHCPRIGVVDTGYLEGDRSVEKEIRLTDDGIVEDSHVKAAILGAEARPDFDLVERAEGHAVFVASVIGHSCLRATLRFEKVQSVDGVVDEATVCEQILDTVRGENPVDIINLSLGCYARADNPPLLLRETLKHVLSQRPDLVVVAAAGNDRSERSFFPAALKGEGFERLISVGGLDADKRADYTNRGEWIDWYAPGTDVVGRYLGSAERAVKRKNLGDGSVVEFSGFAKWEGTSFAAPYVSGLIARMMSCHTAAPGSEKLTAADAWTKLSGWPPEYRQQLGLFRPDELQA